VAHLEPTHGTRIIGLRTMGTVTLRLGKPGAQFWVTLAIAILCLGTVISVVVVRAYGFSEPQTVTVMTRNIYLGGNVYRPVRAALNRTGTDGVLALGHANYELRKVVDRTDFTTRSKLLAEEIAAARPDLVGLQEVALWRRGPMQLDQIGRPNATQIEDDFLATLVADLAERGVSYQIVHVQHESDVEAPAFTGNPFNGIDGSAEDLRLTDRDVILVRSEAGIRIEGSGGGHYGQRLDVTLGDTTFSFVRGYAWADIAIGSERLRFITTHLEAQGSRLARAQAEELLSGPAGDTDLSTIIACDCNSNPASPAARAGIRIGSGAAYRLITNDHGFSDLWLQQPTRTGAGLTAWLSELVDDEKPDFERRIDLVLARSAPSAQIVVSRADVTGDELSDQDPVSKLWPSDHAGVVVELQISER
jgi:endonuclease/exonuclease/phosphatase family metal-dependent hydrolase